MTTPPPHPPGPSVEAAQAPARPAAEPTGRASGAALPRRAFVTGAVLAGTAAGAAAVGVAVGSGQSGGTAAPAPVGAVVLAGPGVDPSGQADSTAGLQTLIDDAAPGALLWLPAGVYLVDGIVLRAGQMLTGPSGPSGRSYTGRADDGARLRARLASQTTAVLTVGELGRVADLAVEGIEGGQPAVRPAGIGAVLERVTMLGGSVGFDAGYASGTLLTGCFVHDNVVGIKDLVDSVVQACVVNANRGDGISLGPGANDNEFVGNKVEWNDGCGLNALQAVHNVVVGGILDRNGLAGIRLVECEHTTVVGSVLRRNGRLAESSAVDDCHVHQRDCTALVVTGIATATGADDDESGYLSPSVAVRDDGGTDVGYTGNDLTGRTSPVAIAVDAAGTRISRVGNVGATGVQRTTGLQALVAREELELAAGATGSVAMPLESLATGGLGATYRLALLAHDTATGLRAAADAVLLVSRDMGDAQVALGAFQDRVGAAFAAADGGYRVEASALPDGSTVTVVVRNDRATPVRIGVELS